MYLQNIFNDNVCTKVFLFSKENICIKFLIYVQNLQIFKGESIYKNMFSFSFQK